MVVLSSSKSILGVYVNLLNDFFMDDFTCFHRDFTCLPIISHVDTCFDKLVIIIKRVGKTKICANLKIIET